MGRATERGMHKGMDVDVSVVRRKDDGKREEKLENNEGNVSPAGQNILSRKLNIKKSFSPSHHFFISSHFIN